MTLEGAALTNDVDFVADVKPVASAHFQQNVLWYSSFDTAPAVTSPATETTTTAFAG